MAKIECTRNSDNPATQLNTVVGTQMAIARGYAVVIDGIGLGRVLAISGR